MKNIYTLFIVCLLLTWTANANAQAYSFTAGQLTYNENFDGMGPTGTAYLTGWTAIRYAGSGTVGATLTMAVTDGSANSGNVYNSGTATAVDRSFGSLGSGSTVPRFGASFKNSTGSSITTINLTGVMEQWRSGSVSTVNEVTAFEYSLDATDLTSGTWVAVPAFDLAEKLTSSAAAAAVDGNLTENQTNLTASITGINWTQNSTIWIRWSDVDNTGSDGLYTIDNMVMAVTTGTANPDPEPSNHPTLFNAVAAARTIDASWIDATGAQLPGGYLVKISKNSSITPPVDGTFSADDLDFTDGSGAKNVLPGQLHYTFSGLEENKLYYLKIFPYTNTGTMVNYKTDGTVPSASASTQSIILSTNFDIDLAPWTQYSVTGDQVWTTDLIHGVNGSGCAKMSGFLVTNFVNEDWLISPSLNLTGMVNTKFQFYSAYNYSGNPLSVLISTNYVSGNPTAATWVDISSSAVFSPGGWVWTPSGFIGITASGTNVRIAFKYTSDATAARTWEIDDFVVAGNPGVSLPKLVITEIMYNSIESTDEEWFEIFNSGTSAVDLSGFYMVDSDTAHLRAPWVFPAGSSIAAGQYYTAKLSSGGAFPFTPNAVLTTTGDPFNLGNTSDEVKIYTNTNQLIDSVRYEDKAPWPAAADGTGPSLTLCDPTKDNSLAANWSASTETLTGTTTKATPGSGCVITGIPNKQASDLIIYPNPTSERIYTSNPTNELFEITIISAIGKTVKSVQSRQTLIDVDMSAFPKGMYIVKLTNKTSNSSRVSKVVVK
jgi:hypothetical protein